MLSLLHGPISHPYMTIGKIISLTRWIFVNKVMSLLFNTLSRFFIAFLPRSKHLLISWLQSSSRVILEPKKIKSLTISTFSPSICHEVIGLNGTILVFWMLSFKLFHSPLTLSSRRSSVPLLYLRLLMLLLAVLIPACDSSSPAFHMMCCACKLNKQGDNI